MVTLAIAVTEVLKQAGIAPDYTAGLSLGEYAALYAAGVFDKKTALELVRFRGIAMQKACEGLSCKMAAVLNLGREELKKACQAGSAFGKVEICNFNCPGQLVISGEAKAVDAACQEALKLGARRTVELNVSGPFHTSFMEPASRSERKICSHRIWQNACAGCL